MSLLSEADIRSALVRLGELAVLEGQRIELLLMGGAAMALVYHARQSTRDVDVVIAAPPEAAMVRRLAADVAGERGWPGDWLNDAAKGYLVGLSKGVIVLNAHGIVVHAVGADQLLAMKLSAWRDDLDISDATRLLRECAHDRGRDDVWRAIQAHLVPGEELKAQYAFDDLWESLHDQSG